MTDTATCPGPQPAADTLVGRFASRFDGRVLVLFGVAVVLLSAGVVMVYSASAIIAVSELNWIYFHSQKKLDQVLPFSIQRAESFVARWKIILVSAMKKRATNLFTRRI